MQSSNVSPSLQIPYMEPSTRYKIGVRTSTTQQKNLDNIVFTPFITTPTQLQKATSTHIPSYIKNGLIGHPLTKKHLWSTSDRANLKIVCTLLQIYFIMRGGDEDEGRVSAWE